MRIRAVLGLLDNDTQIDNVWEAAGKREAEKEIEVEKENSACVWRGYIDK